MEDKLENRSISFVNPWTCFTFCLHPCFTVAGPGMRTLSFQGTGVRCHPAWAAANTPTREPPGIQAPAVPGPGGGGQRPECPQTRRRPGPRGHAPPRGEEVPGTRPTRGARGPPGSTERAHGGGPGPSAAPTAPSKAPGTLPGPSRPQVSARAAVPPPAPRRRAPAGSTGASARAGDGGGRTQARRRRGHLPPKPPGSAGRARAERRAGAAEGPRWPRAPPAPQHGLPRLPAQEPRPDWPQRERAAGGAAAR